MNELYYSKSTISNYSEFNAGGVHGRPHSEVFRVVNVVNSLIIKTSRPKFRAHGDVLVDQFIYNRAHLE